MIERCDWLMKSVIDEWQSDEIMWDMLSKLYLATICCGLYQGVGIKVTGKWYVVKVFRIHVEAYFRIMVESDMLFIISGKIGNQANNVWIILTVKTKINLLVEGYRRGIEFSRNHKKKIEIWISWFLIFFFLTSICLLIQLIVHINLDFFLFNLHRKDFSLCFWSLHQKKKTQH